MERLIVVLAEAWAKATLPVGTLLVKGKSSLSVKSGTVVLLVKLIVFPAVSAPVVIVIVCAVLLLQA